MSSEDKKHRSHLPIPTPERTGLITYDARDPDTKFPPIEQLRPPQGAPNVLIILIDDAGFGSSSAFGGPCQTPNAEKLAAAGLKYNRFHTTALCSPTRAALLTGRNHHSVGMGGITEIATGAPGYSSVLPNTISPLARTVKLNGYSTAQFGKCHEVPVWETSPVGPFDAWPTGGGGFEYFYGFIGGEANQWYPTLYEGTTPVEPKKTPEEGYHLMADMTDKAMAWVAQQKALVPDKPFFVYFAPGATHAPHHVPKEWADKYKGKFDQGWDKLREETIARQKTLGVVPADCQLTARHAEIPAWDDMPEPLKPILRRQMEVYAGFLEYTDHHIGRLLDGLKKLNILDDTLVYYIIGDNGASAEGTLNGAYNEMANFNGLAALETPEFLMARYDKLGGPESYNHYAVGWAHAMSTPYQWTKQVASHWGGTRNGTIVHWPNGIKAKGEIRSQYGYVYVAFVDFYVLLRRLDAGALVKAGGTVVRLRLGAGNPRPLPCELEQHLLDASEHRLDSELPLDELPPGLRAAQGLLRVRRAGNDGRCECLLVLRGYEPPCLAVDDRGRYAPDPGCNDRALERQGLECDDGKPLPTRWKNDDIGRGEIGQCIPKEAGEVDAVSHSARHCKLPVRLEQATTADYCQAGIR